MHECGKPSHSLDELSMHDNHSHQTLSNGVEKENPELIVVR